MNSLKSHLESIPFETNLAEVNRLFFTAQVKTTFWGSRLIVIGGLTGSVSLVTVIEKVYQAACTRRWADDLTREERVTGMDLVNKLKVLYEKTEKEIEVASLFTRFLNWIREFPFISGITVSDRLDTTHKQFRMYSGRSFQRDFGGADSQDSTAQILILEEVIRARRPAPIAHANLDLNVGDRFRFVQRTDPRKDLSSGCTFSFSQENTYEVDRIREGYVDVYVVEEERRLAIPISVLTTFAFSKL